MISTAHYTDQGGRDINEDSHDIVTNGKQICAIVADGLGGHGGGDIASSKAILELRSFVENNETIEQDNLQQYIQKVNEQIYDMQTKDCKMKTTLAVLVTDEEQCFWLHIGDSRVYHFENGVLKDMTFDHSVSQMAVLTGEIQQGDIRHHVDRNKLLRCLGNQEDVRIEISQKQDISSGFHAFLLCSDGFWEYVLEEEMMETLQNSVNPKQWLDQMCVILQSRIPDNNDNNTAVVVWVASENGE